MSAVTDDNLLGTFLKDRRAKLDPAAFGIPCAGDERLDCGARKWRSAPTSVRLGTRGSSKGAAGRPLPTCSTGSRAP